MPDRHGPMRVIFQNQEIPGTTWGDFEENTPNEVLDRTTRGILDVNPGWLGTAMTPGEVAAVQEWFDVSIGGGETDPAERFTASGFDGTRESLGDGEYYIYFDATVEDADTDDDLTAIRIDAEGADGTSGSIEGTPSEGDTAATIEFSGVDPFSDPVSLPVNATLSAADSDSNGSFVELQQKRIDPPS
ncbi:hypothetical protein [Halorubrum sp. LN27]|uniref:hypothetical protein n=1 Tax=Halorubrum sp. LN27 TaxID=2801032 RepID=UPI0019099AD1|nr:hypothetical protein [Halorubrum sp. LN27]